MAFSSSSISSVRFKIYSRFKWRSLISANVLGLHLVDAEADHQVGYDLGFLCGIAHNFNCFIDIQQDSFQAFEQMQALLLALQIVVGAAAHALGAERDPLIQNAAHPQHLGLARNQDIEVAGKAVLQAAWPYTGGSSACRDPGRA